MMRIFPQTKAEWGRFALFPLKAYVVVAWSFTGIISLAIGRAARDLPVEIVLLGYCVCFWALLGGGLFHLWRGRHGETIVAFIFAALALVGLLHPFLSVALTPVALVGVARVRGE
jgi:hypothetical protein